MYLARVYVTLKPTVNDPQGLTIEGGLKSLGFESVNSVRAGTSAGSLPPRRTNGRPRPRPSQS